MIQYLKYALKYIIKEKIKKQMKHGWQIWMMGYGGSLYFSLDFGMCLKFFIIIIKIMETL